MFKDRPLNPALDLPLYQQLYAHLREAILCGELPGGMRLPSTRVLASQYGISRNTILNAYAQLEAEGYLKTTGGSGTFVVRVLPDTLLGTAGQPLAQAARSPDAAEPPTPAEITSGAALQRETAARYSPQPGLARSKTQPFRSEMPGLDAFPYETWSRLVIRRARQAPPSAFSYQDPAGYRPLREAIAAHVTVSRRVHCTPEQILITSGSQGALDLAARVLVHPGDPVWLEDPGYLGARGALLGAGAALAPAPVDREGLDVDAATALAPSARLAYVTPSHQFPLGVTMSLPRRLALLDWARRVGAYILEDDYDSEYRYGGRPLAALQGLDTADRVIYIGTFSKVLFPALRLGYLILPPQLFEPFLTVRRFVDIHPPFLDQAVLADFIAEGHFARHLRRMRTLYAARRSALLAAIASLPLEIDAPEAGIHCIGWLPDGLEEADVLRQAAAQGLDLWPVSKFCLNPLTRQGLLLGYGSATQADLADGIRRLAAALRAAQGKSGTINLSKTGP